MIGEWIKHDGKGCPLKPGTRCRFRMAYADTNWTSHYEDEGYAWERGGMSWDWKLAEKFRVDKVIEYMVQKPKGMKVLENILRKVETEPVKIEEFV